MQNHDDCTCIQQVQNRLLESDILQIGEVGCENHVPEIPFTGFGKAYVPYQKLCRIYKGKTAFERGTIFPELDLPYEGRRHCEH